MNITELSNEEIKIIEKHREAIRKADKLAAFANTVILVLNEWQKWSAEEGMGLTYSTFCDNFNVDRFLISDFLKYRKQIYDIIIKVKKYIYDELTDIGW